MTEPTPPPERPLPDDARARIRAELLAHAHENRSHAPRWAVPAGAAAAVAVVAGLSWWAVSVGGGDTEQTPVTGGGTSSATVLDPAETATPPPTAVATSGTTQVGTRPCEDEMEYVLKGAELAFQVDPSTSFYVKGDRFVLCDVRDGTTTGHKALPLTPREGVAPYAVSTLNEGKQTIRVAGGIVPAGALAYDVGYTFPDGHVEHAQKAADDQGRTWWWMAYAYDDGGGNELNMPPIEVTVSYSGARYHYSLEYGVDTCAQANHGC
jgi:hypothetical protein